MLTIELTDDEFETLHEAFQDVGCDCPGVNWNKFKALGVKLGFWEVEKPPTVEELKRREELANSPLGKQMREAFDRSNALCKQLMDDYKDHFEFHKNLQWTVGSELRIRLPNDYQVKDNNMLHIKDNK